MNFWQGFFVGRWTKRGKSKTEPGLFSFLFSMALAIALVYVGFCAFLAVFGVAVIILVAVWCKTHNWHTVKIYFYALASLATIVAVAAMIIFLIVLLFSAVPALMWIGIILTAGCFLPIVLKLTTLLYQIWSEL